MSETNSLPHVEKTSAKISTDSSSDDEAQCSVTQNKDTGVKPPAEGDDENPRTSTPAAGSKRPGNDDEHPVINLITTRTKRPRENDYVQRGTKPSISYCQ